MTNACSAPITLSGTSGTRNFNTGATSGVQGRTGTMDTMANASGCASHVRDVATYTPVGVPPVCRADPQSSPSACQSRELPASAALRPQVGGAGGPADHHPPDHEHLRQPTPYRVRQQLTARHKVNSPKSRNRHFFPKCSNFRRFYLEMCRVSRAPLQDSELSGAGAFIYGVYPMITM